MAEEPKDIALQWMKENQDRDVSGAEAASSATTLKGDYKGKSLRGKLQESYKMADLQTKAAFETIFKYPRGDKVMAYSDRKIQKESFSQQSKPIDITKDYGGKYDVMEGEYLVMMRKAIEDLAAGKITQEQYDEYYTSFMNEFPPEAIEVLKKDIANDGGKSSEIFGGKVNMNLKESELSTKPNNPKLYDFSKVKPEMFDVHEGDRIKALIDGLKRGESDKQLMEYLINEFDPYVIEMIKNELKK